MKISIVTPTFNRREYLASTGGSILSQRGDFALQWLVVDAGSTDGSVEWLEQLARTDPRVQFTSEPDRGQSDALNKGFSRADGEIVGWLNADDLYAEGALAAVATAFAQNPDAQWLIGRYEVIDPQDRPIRRAIVRYKERRLRGGLPFRKLLRENLIPQPAVFWRRPFGQEVGPLDESLNWTMDYDLWLRMAQRTPPLILNQLLARFRHHPTSKSGAFNRRQFDEGYEVARRYGAGEKWNLLLHRLNVEKIVWSYRVMRLLGR